MAAAAEASDHFESGAVRSSFRQPIRAVKRIRTIRTSCVSELFEGEDGESYVVKPRSQPAGARLLVNEWVVSGLFKYFGLCVPRVATITIDTDLIMSSFPQTKDAWLSADDRQPIYFGYQLPVRENLHSIYDFLPDQLASSVINSTDCIGALAIDRWIGNVTSRRYLFTRGQRRLWRTPIMLVGQGRGFVAFMVEHGKAFNGGAWELTDVCPTPSIFTRPYLRSVTGIASFERWIGMAQAMSPSVLQNLLLSVPPQWLPVQERNQLADLLDALYVRRSEIPGLLQAVREAHPLIFPSWPSR